MGKKTNDPTPLRPEGGRIINDVLVEMDLKKFIEQIKSETTWQAGDRNTITVFKSSKMRIVLIGLKKDAELKEHHAPGYISVQVIQGKMRFNALPQSAELEAGQMVALQPKVPHSVQALEETFFLLTLVL
ncbi:MAG: cupin domain-containing protein [Weeksellaceae bacterium]